MRQIAKWTILCVICTVFGFGATFLVANSDRVIQTFVAMLPASSQPTVGELALADDRAAEMTTVDLAEVAAADLPALAPLSNETTVGTLAAGSAQIAANVAQTIPTTSGPSTGPLNAVGVIAVVRDRQVVLAASGRVDDIAVEVGDPVSAGDLLIALDTTYLDWAVEQAEIGFESARIDFEEAGKEIDEADVAVAEANLLLAQENLAVVQAGATPEELAAAESSATAAWAALDELQAGPTDSEIILAQAALRRAEIAVQAAQREYDKIAWLPEAAATTAADNLQTATISYEEAKAAYDQANQPPTQSQIQSATSAAQSAQDALNKLRLKPTAAELASAQASVAEAEASLADVQEGPQQAAVRQAELGVRQAMIALEDARLAQSSAQVVAPIDGTVLAVNVDLGQQASAGDVVATLADTADVNLTVNVEQRDIARVTVGQQVHIAIYALAEDTFTGVVEQIAPIADAETGFVTFPVIIRFTDGPVEKVLPGMTASATFVPVAGEESSAAPAAEATAEPTVAPTEEATVEATAEATEEPTAEATEEATEEPTEEATVEPTEEATEEATPEPTEEPAAEATATPSN
ncbi:MAG: efflux RND transporter periplasmic adaptor subunit [Caldilineaceae bacterium]|nr:efflux RND transporter periplasmic adaptor subunit [Caldilineaceae bacterium]